MKKNMLPIPFEFAGNLPLFTVKVNGESKQFILDSGAQTMVLNSKYEEDSGTSSPATVAGHVVASVQASFIPSFEWGGMQLSNQMAMVMDLSHLEKRLQTTVHGLIGCAQLANYDLLLDYRKRQVTLTDSYGEVPACMTGAVSLPFTVSQHIPVIPVKIEDKVFSLGLDTGAEGNVLGREHEEYCTKMGLVFDVTQDEVVRINNEDSEQETCFCSIKNIAIGQDLTIDHMRFAFHDINIHGVKADGLMGYELFSRYKAMIRFTKRELLLQPFETNIKEDLP